MTVRALIPAAACGRYGRRLRGRGLGWIGFKEGLALSPSQFHSSSTPHTANDRPKSSTKALRDNHPLLANPTQLLRYPLRQFLLYGPSLSLPPKVHKLINSVETFTTTNLLIRMPASTTSSITSIVKPKPISTSCGEECDCCGCDESCWCVVM